jgi:hypothetical protein
MMGGLVSTVVILVACCATVIAAEPERQPSRDEIIDGCLAFVAATRSASAKKDGTCATCPGAGESKDVFKPVGMDVTQISCSGNRCEVNATIRVTFNPSTGQAITGGLVGWVSPEQRNQWLHGETPSGEQVYHVKITYVREGDHWRAIEFEPGSKS